MRRIYIILYILTICVTATVLSCSDDAGTTPPSDGNHHALSFNIVHPSALSRATEYDFEQGDKIGLYICKAGTTLEPSGNEINNEALTYDGSTWNASQKLFLDNGTYNVYAYYPYTSVTSIEDMSVEVKTDQSQWKDYTASDIMYACHMNYSDLQSPISLVFGHVMSKVTVRLIKSEGYEGDLPTDANVYIHNTVTQATMDFNSGTATKKQKVATNTIKARQKNAYTYEAIVVPQRLDTRVPLIEIEMNGVSYLFESKFIFKKGMNHTVNIVIPSSPDQIKIEIGATTENW